VAKTKRPGQILVEDARIEGCRAQDIYLEAAAACTFRRLPLVGNNKEGICFDWGTSLCLLKDSELVGNGARASPNRRSWPTSTACPCSPTAPRPASCPRGRSRTTAPRRRPDRAEPREIGLDLLGEFT